MGSKSVLWGAFTSSKPPWSGPCNQAGFAASRSGILRATGNFSGAGLRRRVAKLVLYSWTLLSSRPKKGVSAGQPGSLIGLCDLG